MIKIENVQLKLLQKPELWFGDRFYLVQSVTQVTLTSKCPCCENEGTVNVTGKDGISYKVKCPVCNVPHSYKNRNYISLNNWTVNEYIVHKIIAVGPTTISAYKDGTEYVEYVQRKAFCKKGRGASDYLEISVPTLLDRNLDYINVENKDFDDYVSNYAYRNKKEAETLLQKLINRDKLRLEEFNKTFQVNYEYPF